MKYLKINIKQLFRKYKDNIFNRKKNNYINKYLCN